MFNGIKNITRLTQILRILAKHDALFFVQDAKAFPVISKFANLAALSKEKKSKGLRQGQRLSNAFTELGPTFIKLGQALSVRSDIVGEEISEDLANLQDNLPPFDSEVAIRIIETELEDNVDNLFKKFDRTPVAAASIAQVHFAESLLGEQLAIKVLRPGIEKKFMKDLDLLFWIANNVETKLPKYRRLKLIKTVQTFAETTYNEMDLSLEAAAASELAQNFTGDPDIRVPKVYWQKTTHKVLTIERFVGVQINNVKALEKLNLDPNDILHKSANIFMKQSLRDGFFHADMHPGNVLVDKNGKICVFDFGIMGRIDRKTKIFLAEMLLGFLNGDYEKVSDIHFEAGYIPKDQDRLLFAQACRSIGEPIMDLPQNEISIAKLLQQLFRITERFKMETQPQLLLLQKTMMMAEGIGRSLNPNVNFWEISRDIIESWGKDNLGPKARVEDKLKDAISAFDKLNEVAQNLDKIVTDKGILVNYNIEKEIKNHNGDSFLKGFLFATIIGLLLYIISLWQTY